MASVRKYPERPDSQISNAFWGGTQTRHKNRSKPVGQETTLPLRRWIQSLQMEGATGWNPCLRIPMQLPYTKPRKDFCRKESSR